MIRRTMLPLVAGVCMLVGAGSAQAATSQHYSVRGTLAEAGFDSQSGCIDTSAYVFGGIGRVKQTGKPASNSEIDVYVSRYDVCNEQSVSFAWGSIQPSGDELRIDKRLDSATLDATVPVTDYDGNTVPLQVDVTWQGVGDAVKERGRSQYSTAGFKEMSSFSGVFRDANASGTISDGQTDYSPEPAQWAELGKNSYTDITITH
jgi:hypothetical protein